MQGRGKLIVVEGLDNVGKTTFVQYFLKQHPLVISRKFPSRAVADVMNAKKQTDIDWNEFHDLFHDDLQQGIKDIDDALTEGISVICDRFIYSHWVYENLRREEEHICIFKTDKVHPDVIVYLRPKYLERMPEVGKDNLEAGIDYVKGQAEFDRILRPLDNVLTIAALDWDTNAQAMRGITTVLGANF